MPQGQSGEVCRAKMARAGNRERLTAMFTGHPVPVHPTPHHPMPPNPNPTRPHTAPVVDDDLQG
jgi:hypothetical protein